MNERVADPEYDVTVLVYSLIVDDRLGERVMSVWVEDVAELEVDVKDEKGTVVISFDGIALLVMEMLEISVSLQVAHTDIIDCDTDAEELM